MSTLMTSMRRLFGGDTATSSAPTAALKPAKAADPKKDRLKAQEEFKTAVRDSDIPAMDVLLDSNQVAIADEFAGGRGLLQFAVMVNSTKAARHLIERGADATKVDTLGASADTLARKSGSANMARALHPA